MILDESLIPSWHRGHDRFVSLVRLLIEQIDSTSDMMQNLYKQIDIDNAVGIQLDMIGSLLCVRRVLSFTPSSTGDRTLSDENYRMILKSKLATSVWDGSMEGLQNIVSSVFPEYSTVVVDNGNGSITYNITNPSAVTDLQRELISKRIIFPAPAGIATSAVIVDGQNKYTLSINGGVMDRETITMEVEP